MAHRVGIHHLGDLDLALGDQRARDRGAKQIQALIERVRAHHREDEVLDELLAQIVDEDVLGLHAGHLGLLARRLELLALAEVGGEGDHLALIFLLEPFQDHARVQAARIGEHDAVDLVRHGATPKDVRGNGVRLTGAGPLPQVL